MDLLWSVPTGKYYLAEPDGYPGRKLDHLRVEGDNHQALQGLARFDLHRVRHIMSYPYPKTLTGNNLWRPSPVPLDLLRE